MQRHYKNTSISRTDASGSALFQLSLSAVKFAKHQVERSANKVKTIALPLVALSVLAMPGVSNAQTLISHDFNNGNLNPFNACSVRNPNFTVAEDGRVKTFWTQSGYDGSRSTRGAELCADEVKVRKHGWYGVTVNLGADYQTDKQAGIAQVFQFSSPTFWSWVAILDMTDGDLTMTHRGPSPGAKTEAVIYRNFPKQRDMDIVIGFTLSQVGNGEIEVWVNGQSRYHAENISLGFGTWDRNDVQTGDYTFVTFKAGQYNYQADDYRNGDTETVYYDNISWYNGANGYNIVDPSAERVVAVNSRPEVVHVVKRNATGFAIDGNRGASNYQGIYLWGENENNANQQWVEINRGGGFYSYQKNGTNHCIDGGNGGANEQEVFLYTCGDNNRNQQWKKVSTGSGSFRLEKRNSPSYSIDGNRGGSNGQPLYLYNSDNNNRNQQWFITAE